MHALEDAGISLHAVDGKWTASPPIRFKAEADAIRVNVQRHWLRPGSVYVVKANDPGYDLIYRLYMDTLTPPAKA